MKAINFLSVILISVVIAFASCDEDPVEVSDVKAKEVTLSRKTDYGEDWIYYSFVEGKEITVTDNNTSSEWDIAFNRYNVRTNGGESGPGQSGVYDAGKVSWSSVIEANETGYVVDDTIQIVKAFTGQGVEWMTSTGNDIFKGCIDLKYGQQGPEYTANDHIYVLKTAKGKYAKIWVKSFYNDEGKSGYITFKYSYQNGDGRKLE